MSDIYIAPRSAPLTRAFRPLIWSRAWGQWWWRGWRSIGAVLGRNGIR